MSEQQARIAENPNPYDVLTARDALVEAAKLNRDALTYVHMDVESNAEYLRLLDHAVQLSRISRGLSAYALAVEKWGNKP